jgi:hypothetical protein
VDEAEHVAENFSIVGFLLEAHELDANYVEAFVGFDQEISEQLVHAAALARRTLAKWPVPSGQAQCGFEAFNFSCGGTAFVFVNGALMWLVRNSLTGKLLVVISARRE